MATKPAEDDHKARQVHPGAHRGETGPAGDARKDPTVDSPGDQHNPQPAVPAGVDSTNAPAGQPIAHTNQPAVAATPVTADTMAALADRLASDPAAKAALDAALAARGASTTGLPAIGGGPRSVENATVRFTKQSYHNDAIVEAGTVLPYYTGPIGSNLEVVE